MRMRASLFAAALLGATAWAAPPSITVWVPDAPVDAATTRISTVAKGNGPAASTNHRKYRGEVE